MRMARSRAAGDIYRHQAPHDSEERRERPVPPYSGPKTEDEWLAAFQACAADPDDAMGEYLAERRYAELMRARTR